MGVHFMKKKFQNGKCVPFCAKMTPSKMKIWGIQQVIFVMLSGRVQASNSQTTSWSDYCLHSTINPVQGLPYSHNPNLRSKPRH